MFLSGAETATEASARTKVEMRATALNNMFVVAIEAAVVSVCLCVKRRWKKAKEMVN